MKPKMHFIPEYIQNPIEPITVLLIGAGGNGSQMLSALARMDAALVQLNHPGLVVTVYDSDRVEETNIGRQLFTQNDLGQNKAVALVTRFNRIYGTNWNAVPKLFAPNKNNLYGKNIIITCVDKVAVRKTLGDVFRKIKSNSSAPEHETYYWLDLGNGQRTGQAILGSTRQPKSKEYEPFGTLPTVCELFDLSEQDETDSGPSCSLAEALSKQDLFINSSLVQCAASLLWSVLTDAGIDIHGFFLNLDTYKMNPIKI